MPCRTYQTVPCLPAVAASSSCLIPSSCPNLRCLVGAHVQRYLPVIDGASSCLILDLHAVAPLAVRRCAVPFARLAVVLALFRRHIARRWPGRTGLAWAGLDARPLDRSTLVGPSLEPPSSGSTAPSCPGPHWTAPDRAGPTALRCLSVTDVAVSPVGSSLVRPPSTTWPSTPPLLFCLPRSAFTTRLPRRRLPHRRFLFSSSSVPFLPFLPSLHSLLSAPLAPARRRRLLGRGKSAPRTCPRLWLDFPPSLLSSPPPSTSLLSSPLLSSPLLSSHLISSPRLASPLLSAPLRSSPFLRTLIGPSRRKPHRISPLSRPKSARTAIDPLAARSDDDPLGSRPLDRGRPPSNLRPPLVSGASSSLGPPGRTLRTLPVLCPRVLTCEEARLEESSGAPCGWNGVGSLSRPSIARFGRCLHRACGCLARANRRSLRSHLDPRFVAFRAEPVSTSRGTGEPPSSRPALEDGELVRSRPSEPSPWIPSITSSKPRRPCPPTPKPFMDMTSCPGWRTRAVVRLTRGRPRKCLSLTRPRLELE
ncbi:hypothetical protein RJ55_00318 [Drechmeria coniospora]|nr:hypothetical protein RJ55_00318 [Drechmeria coniospora]